MHPSYRSWIVKASLLLVLLAPAGVWAQNYNLQGNTNNANNWPPCSGSWSQSGTTYTCSGVITLPAGHTILPNNNRTLVANGGFNLGGDNQFGSESQPLNLQSPTANFTTGGGTNVFFGSIATTSGTISLNNSTVGSETVPATITASGGGPITLTADTTVYGNVDATPGGTLDIDGTSQVIGTCIPAHPRCGPVAPPPPPPPPPPGVCATDDFNRDSLGSSWSTTSLSGSFGNPRIVNNRLRLTDATANNSTSATFLAPFPAEDASVQIEFTFYAYGGDGADGIALALSDASVPPVAGGFGGSLGYANRTGIDGFAGGWIGIGIDSFGNYSNPTEGRSGGPGPRPSAVAVRGSGAGETGYTYIAGTGTLAQSVRTSTGHRYRISLDNTGTDIALLTVERDTGSGFVTLINAVDVAANPGQATAPDSFLLTLTGSTGGSTDIHEIDDFVICADELEVEAFDHVRITHPSTGLTCEASDIQVETCLTADCSVRFLESTTVNLTPTDANSTWSIGPALTVSGGLASTTLRRSTPGTVTLGVASSAPVASNAPQCWSGGSPSDCSIEFADSELRFEMPTLVAHQPSGPITMIARSADPANPNRCVPSFTGAQSVDFQFEYLDPGTGTRVMEIDGTAISDGVWTPLTLTFDGSAEAQFEAMYSDAGQLRLRARHQDGLLEIAGQDDFVSRPLGLCVETAVHCDDANSTCPVFATAGQAFDVTVRGVGWMDEGGPDLCMDYPDVPNYVQNDIGLASTVVAPVGGFPGALDPGTVNLSGGSVVREISLSEVGVFRLHALPPAGGYFGTTVPGGESRPVGRFIPDRLHAEVNAPLFAHGCTGFTYQGQPFGFAIDPRITLEGRSATGTVTRNYAQDFWRVLSNLGNRVFAHHASRNDATHGSLVTVDPGAPSPGSGWTGTDVLDGQGERTLVGSQLRYDAPDTPPAPFSARVDLTLAAGDLTDADGVCVRNNGACTSVVFADMGGTTLRSGRLRLDDDWRYLESDVALLTVTAEFFDGTDWVLNALDNCTPVQSFTLSNDQGDEVTETGTLPIGEGSTQLQGFGLLNDGTRTLLLEAPGLDNAGFANVRLRLEDAGIPWLRHDWNNSGEVLDPKGRATWGLHRGDAEILHLREVWR